MFTVKCNALGVMEWAIIGGRTYTDFAFGIAVDGSGNSYITGFSDATAFGTTTLNHGGFDTMFIAKLQPGTTGGVTDNIGQPATMEIYPNPSNVMFNLTLKGIGRDKVILMAYDVTGKSVLTRTVSVVNVSIAEKLQLPVPKGIYLLKIVSGKQALTRKVMVE